jgi:TPR repeat protein
MEIFWVTLRRTCLVGLLLAGSLSGCSDSSITDKPNNPSVDAIKPKPDFVSLERQALAGDATAQNEIGRLYSEGGRPVDWSRFSDEELEAIEKNDWDKVSTPNLEYYAANKVKKDATQAVAWFRKAAEQGNADAQNSLAHAYHEGKAVPKDAAKAVEWWRKAADQNHAGAQNALGAAYDHGKGVPKDAAKAVEWFRKAADQGNVYAQNNLGIMYSLGKGVRQDSTEAVEWYRRAANGGNASAQYHLGLAYDHGKGVPKDAVKSVEWYRRAAEQGNANAQNNLGIMYSLGTGCAKDIVRAYMWVNLAATQGLPNAIGIRDLYENWMTSDQIAEAQRLTREWKPGKSDVASGFSAKSGGEIAKVGTATAFVVSDQGHLLSNHHVVSSCSQVRLAGSDKPLKLLPQDVANDLALLQMPDKPQAVAVFRAANDLRQGENIVIYGYPLEGTLAAGGNLSPGVVSALAGVGNNTSQIQISAPVQPGNSGGPVLDGKGQVVGVVVQKLDAVKVAKLTGDVPQNVNFAINEATTRTFLDSNQVPYKTGKWWNLMGKSLEETAAEARKYTVVVECWK